MTANAALIASVSHSDLNTFLRDAAQYYSAGAIYLRTRAEHYRVGQEGRCVIELPVLSNSVTCNARVARRLPDGVVLNVVEWGEGEPEKLWKFVALAWSMLQAAGVSTFKGKPPLPASKVDLNSLVKLHSSVPSRPVSISVTPPREMLVSSFAPAHVVATETSAQSSAPNFQEPVSKTPLETMGGFAALTQNKAALSEAQDTPTQTPYFKGEEGSSLSKPASGRVTLSGKAASSSEPWVDEEDDDDSAGFYVYTPASRPAPTVASARLDESARERSTESGGGNSQLRQEDFAENLYEDDFDDEGFYSLTPSSRRSPDSVRHSPAQLAGSVDPVQFNDSAAEVGVAQAVQKTDEKTVPDPVASSVPWDADDPSLLEGIGYYSQSKGNEIENEITEECSLPELEITEEAMLPQRIGPPREQSEPRHFQPRPSPSATDGELKAPWQPPVGARSLDLDGPMGSHGNLDQVPTKRTSKEQEPQGALDDEFDEFEVDFDEDSLLQETGGSGRTQVTPPSLSDLPSTHRGRFYQSQALNGMHNNGDVDPLAGLYEEDLQIPFQEAQSAPAKFVESTQEAESKPVAASKSAKRLPPKPVFVQARTREGKHFKLKKKSLTLIILELEASKWTGWLEMDSHKVVRRVRLEKGEVVHIEERPFPPIGLLSTAATGIAIRVKDFSPYELLLSTDDFPEHTLASQQVISQREACCLMSRRVSIQLARAMSQGWVGEAWLQPDGGPSEAISPRPTPPVPLNRMVWTELRSHAYALPQGALLTVLGDLNWPSMVFDGSKESLIDEQALRPEEAECISMLKAGQNGDVMFQLEEDSDLGLAYRTTCWTLLRLGALKSKA